MHIHKPTHTVNQFSGFARHHKRDQERSGQDGGSAIIGDLAKHERVYHNPVEAIRSGRRDSTQRRGAQTFGLECAACRGALERAAAALLLSSASDLREYLGREHRQDRRGRGSNEPGRALAKTQALAQLVTAEFAPSDFWLGRHQTVTLLLRILNFV